MGEIKIPARIAWAVDVLAVKPADAVLEIGCGRGVAIECIAPQLAKGIVTGIDRSAVAIAAAEARNRTSIREGKASFVRSSLADFTAERTFNRIFAVNVNVFWLSPAKELARLRELLAPNGKVYLFYEPPAGQLARIERDCARHLELQGFRIDEVVHRALGANSGICITAT